MNKIAMTVVMCVMILAIAGCPQNVLEKKFINNSQLLTSVIDPSTGDRVLGDQALPANDLDKYVIYPLPSTVHFIKLTAYPADNAGAEAAIEWNYIRVKRVLGAEFGHETMTSEFVQNSGQTGNDYIFITNSPTTTYNQQEIERWWYPYPYAGRYPCYYWDGPYGEYWEPQPNKGAEKSAKAQWVRLELANNVEDVGEYLVTVQFTASTLTKGEEVIEINLLLQIDGDGDGWPNRAEEDAGTDPLDPNSHPTDNGSQTYTLTTSVVGSGSVSPSGGTFQVNEDVTLYATPASGWRFDHWEIDASGTTQSVTVRMDRNKSARAVFTQSTTNQYTLTTSVQGNGSVSPSGGSYAAGTSVSVTATPANGWRLNYWTGAASGSTNPVSITMDSNKTVTAVFVQNTPSRFTLSTNVIGSGSIALSPSGGTYDANTSVGVTATPASGWRFDHWEGDLTGEDQTTVVYMSNDRNVTAVFVRVTTLTYTLTTSVNQASAGTVTPAGVTTHNEGAFVTITAQANAGYHFGYWSGDANGNQASVTIQMERNKVVMAVFIQNGSQTVTLGTWVQGEGDIWAIPIGPDYQVGTEVALEAFPFNNWRFHHWQDVSGATISTTAGFMIYMDQDKTATAVFVPVESGYPPQVVWQPDSCTRRIGESATFTAYATGDNISYQWLVNGSVIANQTNQNLTITNITEGMNHLGYQVRITNEFGENVTSNNATLWVRNATDAGTGARQNFRWNGSNLELVLNPGNTKASWLVLGTNGKPLSDEAAQTVVNGAQYLVVDHYQEWRLGPEWHTQDQATLTNGLRGEIIVPFANWDSSTLTNPHQRTRHNCHVVMADGTRHHLYIEHWDGRDPSGNPLPITHGAFDTLLNP